MQAGPPLVGLIADRRHLDPHDFHLAGEKYLQALWDASQAYPVVLPSLSGSFDVLDIIDRLDGLLLTGSPSNVEPKHYMGEPSDPGTWHDPERDLAAQGYPILRHPVSYTFAWVHAIRIQDGKWDGGADPATDGLAAEV